MRHKLIRRRYIAAAVVVVLASIAGTAYALAADSPNGPSAASGGAALRDYFTARVTAGGKPGLAPADGARISTAAEIVDGGEWSLSTYRNAAGELCFSDAIPGEGRGYSCNTRTAIFARGPLYVSWGSRQLPGGDLTKWEQAWVLGFATLPVSTVQLVYTDCAVKNLALNPDGAFHAVVGRAAMRKGSWPFLLRGLDTSGAVVAEDRADLQQPNAHGAPIKAPSPGASCAS
jgi:hypothetical protein